MSCGYFLLPAACFAATACFLLSAMRVALDCFWLDFFWFDFGDLSPITFFFRGLTRLRHKSFSEGKAIMRGVVANVNPHLRLCARAVDAGLVTLYWHIGRRVHRDILNEKRAE